MRAASRVMELLGELFGIAIPVPHWTTGRIWLQRLGHAVLTMPQPHADDWAWLIDHTVQIGQEKCLVILGIRLSQLPVQGTALAHEDMQLIALVPRKSWTRAEVAQALEATVARTGVPRVIIDDHGVDVAGGVEMFQANHPETMEIYDIKHKAACLLKQRLEKNERWKDFQLQTSRTRCAIQQTELGALVPPGPRTKARFMNLESQLRWAQHVLQILDKPSAEVLKHMSLERLEAKLGWIRGFRGEIAEWSSWQHVMDVAVTMVSNHGIFRGVDELLQNRLPPSMTSASTRELAEELVRFVRTGSQKTRSDERFPGSTEILESCFGQYKFLERDQARGGLTKLVIAFGSLIVNVTHETIHKAFAHSHVKDTIEWCRTNLGTTLFAQRKLAYQSSATESA
jgi:hypothetical protein